MEKVEEKEAYDGRLEKQFIEKVSKNIALLFNQIIFRVNSNREALEMVSGEELETKTKEKRRKKEVKVEVVDLVKVEEEEIQFLTKLRKKSRAKEEDYDKPKKPTSSFFIYYQDKLKDWKLRQN